MRKIIDSKRISDGNTELTRMVKQYESELSDIANLEIEKLGYKLVD